MADINRLRREAKKLRSQIDRYVGLIEQNRAKMEDAREQLSKVRAQIAAEENKMDRRPRDSQLSEGT
jgi:peptidoglycan hydrolase CwlO-like protein